MVVVVVLVVVVKVVVVTLLVVTGHIMFSCGQGFLRLPLSFCGGVG